MLHIYIDNHNVASINKQGKLASGYRPHEPWLLLYAKGRIERFATQKEAKQEAKKTWPGCTFRRI